MEQLSNYHCYLYFGFENRSCLHWLRVVPLAIAVDDDDDDGDDALKMI